jgi:AcrR family transcriptional regulator
MTKKLNKSGQVLGHKGSGTQARILAATASLLRESRGVPPTLAALAREVGITSPTFYLYFRDVGEAIAALVRLTGERLDDLVALLENPWPKEKRFVLAEAFVRAYFEYWKANAPALRARNRLADQGDERFVQLRIAATSRLMSNLARHIGNPPVPGGLPCSPHSTAAWLITALERQATVMILELYPSFSPDLDDSIRSMANLFGAVIAGV